MIGSQAGSDLATSHAALFASKEGVTHPSELSFPLKLYQDSISQKLQYRAGYLTVSQLAKIKLSL